MNNPVRFIDPDGMAEEEVSEEKTWKENEHRANVWDAGVEERFGWNYGAQKALESTTQELEMYYIGWILDK